MATRDAKGGKEGFDTSILSPLTEVLKYVVLGMRMALVREVECQCCGEVVDLVGYWRCGCGFAAPRERHVLEPCDKCGKVFSWIQCPCCGMSIKI